jgi:tetratricopeptide (TPR) repeat protein
MSTVKPAFLITFMLLLTAICHVSLADENLLEKFVGKDDMNSSYKIPDGCADNLNPEALKIVKAANRNYWIKNKTREIVNSLKKAVILEPRLYAAYPNLILYYCKALKKCELAITLLENGINHCPNWAEHNAALGRIYSGMGKYNLALKEYAKAEVKGVTESASYYYNLGNTHGKLKHFDEAIENFLKSLEMNEKHFNARKNLIVTYVMQNKNQEALKQVRLLLNLKPDKKMNSWAKGALEHLSK